MNYNEIMEQLKKWGTAQNRKIYKRHGGQGKMFGVSFANLKKLKKKIKEDHELAQKLWKSKNVDAMTLATMIENPEVVTLKQLNDWIKDIDYTLIGGMFGGLVAQTPHAKKKMRQWMKSKNEFVKQVGYVILATALKNKVPMSPDDCKLYIDMIKAEIHVSPNKAKLAMNNALIAIGVYKPELEKDVISAAKKIGKVDVDHGETSCKTPDIIEYIKKTKAYYKKKNKK